MTCCAGPLVALAGGAAVISTIMGIVDKDVIMVLGGIAAFAAILWGYRFYRSRLISK